MNIKAKESCVGLFWGIPQSGDDWAILTDAVSLGDAKVDGDFQTHPYRHDEIWHGWQQDAALRRERQIPNDVLHHDYQYFPRGRVVLKTWPKDRFIIYADQRLQETFLMQDIASRFGLAFGNYVVFSDEHYRT